MSQLLQWLMLRYTAWTQDVQNIKCLLLLLIGRSRFLVLYLPSNERQIRATAQLPSLNDFSSCLKTQCKQGSSLYTFHTAHRHLSVYWETSLQSTRCNKTTPYNHDKALCFSGFQHSQATDVYLTTVFQRHSPPYFSLPAKIWNKAVSVSPTSCGTPSHSQPQGWGGAQTHPATLQPRPSARWHPPHRSVPTGASRPPAGEKEPNLALPCPTALPRPACLLLSAALPLPW